VTGAQTLPVIGPRRPGDVPYVVADVTRARRELGWQAKRGLQEMVASTWTALQLRCARPVEGASAAVIGSA
jgi:UDP-glucose 4-epimerase